MRVRLALDGFDISDAVLVEGVTIEQDSTEGISTAEFNIIQQYGVGRYDSAQYSRAAYVYEWELKEWAEIVLWDQDTTQILFAGYILQLERRDEAQHLRYDVRCSDWAIVADRTLHTQTWPAGTLDADVVRDLVAVLPGFSEGVIVPRVALGEFAIKDQSVRDALAQLCELTGGEWNSSYDAKINYYESGSIVAPFGLSDHPRENFVPYQLDDFGSDFADAANQVVVLGALTDAGEIRATANHGASQDLYGLLSATVIDRQIGDQETADLLAETEVATRALPKPTVTASLFEPGLSRGMTVDLEAVKYGVTASLILRKLTIVIAAPDRARTPEAGHVIKYTATLGWRPPDIVYSLRRMQRKPVERTDPPASPIAPGSIEAEDFASSIEPVHVVESLPALPAPGYSDTAVALWINAPGGPQLYRRTGNSWTDYIDAASIEGQLHTSQFAPGSVTSAVLADGSVVTAKIPGGAITAPQLGEGSVTGPAIGPGAVTGPAIASEAITAGKLAAGAVTAGTIAAGAVTAGTVGAGAITAGAIAAGAVTATALAAGSVTANAIAANAIAAENIQANAIQSQHLTANAVTAGKIAALAVTAGTIAADAVTAGTIAAGAVSASSIAAGAVTAGKLAAGAVTAGTIAAGAVTAGTVGAGAITAGNIQAGSIDSTKLSAVEIAVGYGGDKPGKIGVYNSFAKVAVIGNLSDAGLSDFGGWFKLFGAGGTGYFDAKIKSDAAGNLAITNSNFTIAVSGSTVSMTPATIDSTYGSLAVQVADASNSTSIVSRGVILYQGGGKIGSFNRAPGGPWAELVMGSGGSTVIIEGGSGTVRADGGFTSAGQTGVTRSVTISGVTLNFKGGICTSISP